MRLFIQEHVLARAADDDAHEVSSENNLEEIVLEPEDPFLQKVCGTFFTYDPPFAAQRIGWDYGVRVHSDKSLSENTTSDPTRELIGRFEISMATLLYSCRLASRRVR